MVDQQLDGFGVCVPGPDAAYNEDDFRVDPGLGLAIVSAGMGAIGGQGRPSAKLAIWSLLGHLEAAGNSGTAIGGSAIQRVSAGLERAAQAISRLFHGGDMHPPGAMFSAVYLDGSQAILAHVGAARIYHLRAATLVSVSEDHTLANEAATRGLEIEPHHARIVTRVLGFVANGGPTVREVEVREGDRFVLCTRPVHEVLDERVIVDLASEGPLERSCHGLLAHHRADPARSPYHPATLVVAEVTRATPIHPAHGASSRPTRSWLYAPGQPLPEPPGRWPRPDAAWFSEVYGLVMGEDG